MVLCCPCFHVSRYVWRCSNLFVDAINSARYGKMSGESRIMFSLLVSDLILAPLNLFQETYLASAYFRQYSKKWIVVYFFPQCWHLSDFTTWILAKKWLSGQCPNSMRLPQGSPLLVIVYIFYNASLLTQASDMTDTTSLGFIDHVAFVTADKSPNTVWRRLQILANWELEWRKQHGAAFDQKKSQWMILTHWSLTDDLPQINLGEGTLGPQPQIKWLGVILDQKLTVSPHGRAIEKAGTRVVLQLARLARSGWGIPLTQCLQLIGSLI